MVDQIPNLFSPTHKVKTQQVIKSRGHPCGDIELVRYLTNVSGPLPLVLDLRITHDRFGSSSDPSLNGNLHYPNNIDRSLNETVDDKIRKFRSDYNNNPPNTVSFMVPMTSTSGRLHSECVRLLFLYLFIEYHPYLLAHTPCSRFLISNTKNHSHGGGPVRVYPGRTLSLPPSSVSTSQVTHLRNIHLRVKRKGKEVVGRKKIF